MNRIFYILIITTLFSCSKKVPTESNEYVSVVKIDTTPVDSFSAGASSVNVAAQIRKSSKSYQDSLKAVFKKQEEERKLKEEIEKLKAEEQKKKKEAEKQNQNSAAPTDVPVQ